MGKLGVDPAMLAIPNGLLFRVLVCFLITLAKVNRGV
jgi:hypothetical protein